MCKTLLLLQQSPALVSDESEYFAFSLRPPHYLASLSWYFHIWRGELKVYFDRLIAAESWGSQFILEKRKTVLTTKFFSAALELFVHITWSSSARRNERNDDLFSFSSRARPEDKHNRWKSACDQIWPRLCFSDRSDDLFNSKLKSILGNFFLYFISFIVQAFLPARRRMFKELRLLWSEYLNHRRRRLNSPSPSSPASRRTCYYLFLHLVVIMLSSVFPSHSPFHSSLVKSRLMKHNSKL